MGADMIGFLVRGPKYIPESKLREATQEGLLRVRQLRACERLYDQYLDVLRLTHNTTPPLDVILREARIRRKLAAAMSTLEPYTTEDTPDACDKVLLEWDWLFMEEGKTRDVVGDFVAMWNGQHTPRDTVRRYWEESNGTEFQVLFAGDRSWGDEPDGYGYQLFKTVDGLALLGTLGLS